MPPQVQQTDQLYEDITTARKSEKTHFAIIMGDFNSKIGDTNTDNIPSLVLLSDWSYFFLYSVRAVQWLQIGKVWGWLGCASEV